MSLLTSVNNGNEADQINVDGLHDITGKNKELFSIYKQRIFLNRVAYAFYYNIFGGITTFNLYFNVITFMQSFKRTFKKSAYIRMHIKFPSYARITSNGPLFRAFC